MRGVTYQIWLLVICTAGAWYLAHNTVVNMATRGIRSGWAVFGQPAGFDISESAIPYDAMDSYPCSNPHARSGCR